MKKHAYELSAAARLDLLQAWNYIAEHSTTVADKVLANINGAIRKVARMPGLGHRRFDLTARDLLFYRVNAYLVIYRPDKKPLNVVRVLHASRDVKALLAE